MNNKKEEKIKDEFNNKVAEILIKAQRGDGSAVKQVATQKLLVQEQLFY